MSDTSRRPLSEVIRIKHGYAFSGSEFVEDGRYPTVLTPGNFQVGGGFKHAKPKTFSGAVPDGYILEQGALVVTMTDLSREGDTLGLPAVIPESGRYLHNQRIGLVEVLDADAVDLRFLNYFLRTVEYRTHVLSGATGSTVRHTSPARIGAFEAKLPSVDEQRAIADVLGALDDKIAGNSRAARLAEELAVVVLAGERPSTTVGALAHHRKVTVSPDRMDGTFVAHFSLPAFDAGGVPETARPEVIKSSKFSIERPAVLISKLNPRFPRVWNLPVMPELSAVASTEFLVLEPSSLSTSVLWAVLSQREFTSALDAKVAGTSGSHQRVRPGDLLDTPVIDPNLLDPSIVATITSLGAFAENIKHENITLASVRDSLLPSLISGELQVRDAEQPLEEVL